jgi:SAM-dependent methyltransferase/small basic protein
MLYAVTILLSAFLLFQVQPIIAKMILPWFGGSAAVWTTCMLFFQLLLVAGYAYSHWSMRSLKPRTQTLVHLALLAAAIAALPILPDAGWKPAGESDPSLRILGLLAASVGLPYFLLATTSPLVQAWYARAEHGAMPYRLYALSNLGSMLALVTYPFVFEPWLPTRVQALGWSGAFVVFALACGALAWRSRTAPAEIPVAADGEAAAPRLADYALWAGLAAAASILLLAFTSHLSQNVAPIPFLWVLPLALYLLSFILCFEGRNWYRRTHYLPLLAAGFVGVAVTLHREFHNPQLWVMIPLYCATLFIACMVCHGELARMKPHPRHLTAFFVALAVGGALGGVFVGLVAPRAFRDLWELPVGVVLTAALVAVVLARDRAGFPDERGQRAAVASAAFFTAVLAAALAWIYVDLGAGVRLMTRNFYASLKVYDSGNGPDAMRVLTHGTITHGKQFLDPSRRDWPTTYYGETSGVGRAIAAKRARGAVKIGVIGLGAGTLVAYGRPGDAVRVYELNPQVVDLALNEFTYLGDTKAGLEVVLGDARLSLEAEPPQAFDVLAVDAFSSDSIPVHLLTTEAFEVYFRHLKPDGILAVHISNRYLDLKPVLSEAATKFGKQARIVEDDSNDEKGTYGTTWVLFADSAAAFDSPPLAGAVEALTAERSIRLWTDDYSDLYAILK